MGGGKRGARLWAGQSCGVCAAVRHGTVRCGAVRFKILAPSTDLRSSSVESTRASPASRAPPYGRETGLHCRLRCAVRPCCAVRSPVARRSTSSRRSTNSRKTLSCNGARPRSCWPWATTCPPSSAAQPRRRLEAPVRPAARPVLALCSDPAQLHAPACRALWRSQTPWFLPGGVKLGAPKQQLANSPTLHPSQPNPALGLHPTTAAIPGSSRCKPKDSATHLRPPDHDPDLDPTSTPTSTLTLTPTLALILDPGPWP